LDDRESWQRPSTIGPHQLRVGVSPGHASGAPQVGPHSPQHQEPAASKILSLVILGLMLAYIQFVIFGYRVSGMLALWWRSHPELASCWSQSLSNCRQTGSGTGTAWGSKLGWQVLDWSQHSAPTAPK
jgi:hypothetical protein